MYFTNKHDILKMIDILYLKNDQIFISYKYHLGATHGLLLGVRLFLFPGKNRSTEKRTGLNTVHIQGDE